MRTASTPSNGLAGLASIGRSLRSRNFALFFGGQGVSLIGTWMQQVAVWWLAYRLTRDLRLIGLLGFIPRLPTLLLAPVAGVVADRYERRRAIVITQALAMCQALVLAYFTFTGGITFWHLFVLSILLGVVNAFDIPLRQSFIAEMVGKREDIGNAIALNSFLVNGSRIVGPAIAGVLITLVGEAWCFFLNGASYLTVIAALLAMRLAGVPVRPRRHVFHELGEGFAYVFRHPVIRKVLPLVSLISIMGMPYMILMPAFAKDVLGGNADTNGFLMASVGVGALLGALLLASRRDHLGLPNKIALAAGLFGAGLIAFSFSRAAPLAMVFMSVVGFGMMVTTVSCNTLIQTVVDEDKRGRVMSMYTMAFMGMAPFGNLLAGWLAHRIGEVHGVPWTLAISGLACIAGSAAFGSRLPMLNRRLREAHARAVGEAARKAPVAGGVAPMGEPAGAVFPVRDPAMAQQK